MATFSVGSTPSHATHARGRPNRITSRAGHFRNPRHRQHVDLVVAAPVPRAVWTCQRSLLCDVRLRAAEVTGSQSILEIDPTVEEVMNPRPIVLRDDMPIKEAVQTLLKEDIAGAPVVDASGHLVGVLSESDLIWKGAGTPTHVPIPIFLGFLDATVYMGGGKQYEDEVHKILAKTVSEAMSKGVQTVEPSTRMSDAAKLMLSKEINLLPVVEGPKVVGILTRHDVLRGIYASHSPFL